MLVCLREKKISILTLTTTMLAAYCWPNFSKTGAITLHGPHQVAKKSMTTTLSPAFFTCSSKSAYERKKNKENCHIRSNNGQTHHHSLNHLVAWFIVFFLFQQNYCVKLFSKPLCCFEQKLQNTFESHTKMLCSRVKKWQITRKREDTSHYSIIIALRIIMKSSPKWVITAKRKDQFTAIPWAWAHEQTHTHTRTRQDTYNISWLLLLFLCRFYCCCDFF